MKLKVLSAFILSLMLVLSFTANSQSIPDDSLYLGQTPPGDTPEIFAPGIINTLTNNAYIVAISPDGSQLFFDSNTWPHHVIKHMEYKNGKWTSTTVASFSINQYPGEPSFSPDGKRVYYYAFPDTGTLGNTDIYYSEKQDSAWGNPVSLGGSMVSNVWEFHPCIINDSSIYYTNANGEVCNSQYKSEAYQIPVVLTYPINFANTGTVYADAYVDPNESYMIFRSNRVGGFGNYDLYISYKHVDGSWTNPKNLGNKINTAEGEGEGDITPDGKYMIFYRTHDLYWVSASFIDSLKHTNFVPYVKRAIPNQTTIKDSLFSYQISDSTFIDDDGNNTLRYTAALSNGNPLPAWLSLDSVTCIFSGTPDTPAIFNIKVTATDTAGASVSSSAFRLTVTNPPSAVKEEKNQRPEEFKLDQNYPNPFNPSTTLRYSLAKSSFVRLTICNLLGQKIRTLQNSFQSAGEHSLVWDAMDEKNNPVSSGIYIYKLETNNRTLQKKMLLIR